MTKLFLLHLIPQRTFGSLWWREECNSIIKIKNRKGGKMNEERLKEKKRNQEWGIKSAYQSQGLLWAQFWDTIHKGYTVNGAALSCATWRPWVPPAPIFIMGGPRFGFGFLAGNLVRTVRVFFLKQQQKNSCSEEIIFLVWRPDFFVGGYLMVNAVMSSTGWFFLEAVSGDQRHYTKMQVSKKQLCRDHVGNLSSTQIWKSHFANIS